MLQAHFFASLAVFGRISVCYLRADLRYFEKKESMKILALEFIAALFIGLSAQAQTADSVHICKTNAVNAGKSTMAVHHMEEFDPKHDAEKDIRTAVVQARKEHKHILLDVGGQWCIWCRMLDTLYMKNQDLSDYLYRHYIVVKVNFSKENKNTEVLSHYPEVAGYPHLFILDKNGKLLHSEDTSELELPEGSAVRGHDKAKVFAFLKKWARK
jgi:thiol:disulfide interchange protein